MTILDPPRDTALCTLSAFILGSGVVDKALGFLFPSISGQAARPPEKGQEMAPLPSLLAAFSLSPPPNEEIP